MKLTPSILSKVLASPDWPTLKTSLDNNLYQLSGPGSYQGSQLEWIADYGLGYQALLASDPVTANKYAGKALAIMLSALRDYQKGGNVCQQFVARGDGVTTVYTLPNSDIIPNTFLAFAVPTWTVPIVRSNYIDNDTYGKGILQDLVWYYSKFIKVSDTNDGPANYVEGVDWKHTGDIANGLIDWSPSVNSGHLPALNATYYVTHSNQSNGYRYINGFHLNGGVLTIPQPLLAGESLYVQYIYGTDFRQTSSGDGGFDSILVDTTYTSRYLGKFVAQGLYWLQGYAGLTPAIQAEAIAMLLRWSDFVRDKGYLVNCIESNYGAGGYVSRVYTAAALQGLSDQASRLLTEVTNYRATNVVPKLSAGGGLAGGWWVEGLNYGAMSIENILLAADVFENIFNIPATTEHNWANQLTECLISAAPTPNLLYDSGDWYAYPTPFPKKPFELISYFTDSVHTGYANYVLQNYSNASYWIDHETLLFKNTTVPPVNPNVLPSRYLAVGAGLSLVNTPQIWTSLECANLMNCDHQLAAPGHIQIKRGSDDLLIFANAPSQNHDNHTRSPYANVVIVDDNGEGMQTYRFEMGYWYGPSGVAIKNYEAGSGYTYEFADYTNAFNSASHPAYGPATLLTRQKITKDNLVAVYDKASTVKPTYLKRLQWHTLPSVNVSGNNFVVTRPLSKLFGNIFSKSPITVGSTGVYSNTATQIFATNTSPANNVNYVSTFEVVPSASGTASKTTYLSVSDGVSEAAQIGKNVFVFANQVASPLSYQFDDAGVDTTHVVVGVVPNTVYTTTGNLSATATPKGVLILNVPAGGVQVMQLSSSGQVVPVSPASPTNLTATAGNSQVTLTWTPSVGATSYNIYMNGIVLVGVTNTTYTDTGLVNGQTYSFQVTALNSAGESAKTPSVSVTPVAPVVPPAPPTNLSATAGNTTAKLSWTPVAGATSYNIYVNGSLYSTNITDNPHTVAGLVNGQSYAIQITSVNSNGESSKSTSVSVTPMTPAVTTPPVLVSVIGTGNSEYLTWTAVTGATSYIVYQNGVAIGVVTSGLNYNDLSVKVNNTYSYYVTALGATGESLPSNTISANTSPPITPTGFTGVPGNGTAIISWNPVTPQPNSYVVYNLYKNSLLYKPNLLVTTFTDTGLTNGTSYTYEVAASNPFGQSRHTNALTIVPTSSVVTVPATPTNLTAIAGNTKITLNWTAVPGAISYNLYLSGSMTPFAVGVLTPTFVDTGLVSGQTYSFQVTAVNSAGESGKSNVANGTPLPPLPATPSLSRSVVVTLSWTQTDASVISYNVYRVSGNVKTKIGQNITQNTYTDSMALAGNVYVYTVAAVNMAGEGPQSNTVTISI